jgi:hypothetical protein
VPAINTEDIDYVACATQLAHSLRQHHPGAKIALVTNTECEHPVFDHVIPLPWGDVSTGNNKQINDWQMYTASPFRQTIKLEADMIAAGPVDHWWNLFEHRDLVISQGCRTFLDEPAASRFYRKIFDHNHLPDVYNAITYWRACKFSHEFFQLVRDIFENWAEWRTLLKFPDNEATTDVVYAMAAQVQGVEQVTLPPGLGPTIVHMKRHIQPIIGEDWTQELVWESTDPGLRIQTIAQHGFFHYHVKHWRMQ